MTQAARRGLLKRWESFWFEAIPGDSLAILRILFGVLGLSCLLGLTPVSTYWPLEGIVPPAESAGFKAWLLGIGFGTFAGWAIFLALCLLFACMTLGYRTGSVIPLCFVGSVLQVLWNRLPLSGANSSMIVVLFCLAWADCAGRPSIDAWLASRTTGNAGGLAAPRQPILPLRLLRIQIGLIYLSSGLWKFFGETWRDGSAIHYALSLNGYQRFPDLVPPDLAWMTTLATYGTLFWELGFVVMLFHRWTRMVALIAGVLIHVGIWATLELGSFSFVLVASYVAFLDPDAVSRAVQRWTQRNVSPSSARANSVSGRAISADQDLA